MLKEITADSKWKQILFNFYKRVLDKEQLDYDDFSFKEKVEMTTAVINPEEGFQLFVDYENQEIYVYDDNAVCMFYMDNELFYDIVLTVYYETKDIEGDEQYNARKGY